MAVPLFRQMAEFWHSVDFLAPALEISTCLPFLERWRQSVRRNVLRLTTGTPLMQLGLQTAARLFFRPTEREVALTCGASASQDPGSPYGSHRWARMAYILRSLAKGIGSRIHGLL